MQIQLIKKHIVLDEDQTPVAVMIAYQDWGKIVEILQRYQQNEENPELTNNARALAPYVGCIQLMVDPLDYQRQVREAWLYRQTSGTPIDLELVSRDRDELVMSTSTTKSDGRSFGGASSLRLTPVDQ